MIVVADGGSTKVDWRIIDGNKIHAVATVGINPLFVEEADIVDILLNSDLNKFKDAVTEVFFYGAGLAGEVLKEKLKAAFVQFFSKKCTFTLEDDLMASARALFGNGSGIAAILGTGANSCIYTNGKVADKTPALGYILGDEGSGAYIGKVFVNAIFKRQLPLALTQKIVEENKLDMMEVIAGVYKKPFPNRYLASFTKILIKYIDEPAIASLVENAFREFIGRNIANYADFKNKPVGFVGSVAWFFRENLEKVLAENGIQNIQILQSPIDQLLDYHQKNLKF